MSCPYFLSASTLVSHLTCSSPSVYSLYLCLSCWIIIVLCTIVLKSELILPLLFQIWRVYANGAQVWTPVKKALNRPLEDRFQFSRFFTPLNDSCWMFTVFYYVWLCLPVFPSCCLALSPVVLLGLNFPFLHVLLSLYLPSNLAMNFSLYLCESVLFFILLGPYSVSCNDFSHFDIIS